MDAERIKAIIELSKQSGACEIAVETPDGIVRVRRRPRVLQRQAPAEPALAVAAPEPTEAEPAVGVQPEEYIVRAANVGWFHRGAGPDAEPFVEVGQQVERDQPLATIETLKMSNQVTAEAAGEVKEIMAEEGVEVEFGQPLFVIGSDAE